MLRTNRDASLCGFSSQVGPKPGEQRFWEGLRGAAFELCLRRRGRQDRPSRQPFADAEQRRRLSGRSRQPVLSGLAQLSREVGLKPMVPGQGHTDLTLRCWGHLVDYSGWLWSGSWMRCLGSLISHSVAVPPLAASRPPCEGEFCPSARVFYLAADYFYQTVAQERVPAPARVPPSRLSPRTPLLWVVKLYLLHKFPRCLYCLNTANSFLIGFRVRSLFGKQSV